MDPDLALAYSRAMRTEKTQEILLTVTAQFSIGLDESVDMNSERWLAFRQQLPGAMCVEFAETEIADVPVSAHIHEEIKVTGMKVVPIREQSRRIYP